MSAASTDRRSRFATYVLVGALFGGFVACATQGGAPSQATTPDVAVLSDVHVDQRGEVTVVTLQGVGNPLFTAVEEEGGHLVVDLNEVRPEGVPDSIALVSGVVDEVEVAGKEDSAGRPFTRVGLHVNTGFEYDVVPEGADLAIRVIPSEGGPVAGLEDGSVAGSEQPESAQPAAEEPMETAEAAETMESPAEPASPATTISAIETSEGPEGLVVHVRADGRIDKADAFALEAPDRLVVDLPGLTQHLASARVAVDAPEVSAVRVGQHPDKVRIVLDGGSAQAPFQSFHVDPADDGLVISFGEAAMQAAAAEPMVEQTAEPAAEEGVKLADASGEPAAEPFVAPAEDADQADTTAAQSDTGADQADMAATPKSEETPAMATAEASSRVDDVLYNAGAGSARVVVVSNGSPSYQLFQPDDETVVLSMPDTQLAPGAETRITPTPGGPVSLVAAFQQPETARPEVRVVVTRGAGLEPQVAREGSNVVLTFAENVRAAVTPPVLAANAPGSDAPGGSAPGGPETSTAPAKAMASATAPSKTPPAAIGDDSGIELLKEGGLLDGKQYVGRRISLDFKDVAIDDVLRLIAEVSDLNIIAGDEVNGKVTLRLVDVPWDQALDVILLTKGLGFVKVGNVLRIAPQATLKSETEARLQERRAKEKLEDLTVKFQPVNYASVSNVKGMVQRLLTARGSVNTDTRTNTVIIKDIPSVIDEAVALIKAIDTPTPQVLIEAKIVEANLDFTRELGTVWGAGVQRYNDAFDTSSGDRTNVGARDFRLHPDLLLLDGNSDLNNFVVTNPISAATTGLLNLGSFLLDEKYNLELQLQAAESTGEGKVISSPRVVTLDNREAKIEQGVSIPFQTFENGDAQLEFVDAVLQLKVKPHITADKSIIMALEVSRNAPDDSVAAPGGAPAIAKNQAKTETLVRDGQTLVIGGIYTVQKSDRHSRVPYLHKIPVLGLLFRNSLVRDIRKELLIFVTPRVVDTPQLGS